MDVSAFHFLHPGWLLALPPLLFIALWLNRGRRRDNTWSKLVDSDLLPLLRLSEGGRGPSPWWLLAAAWTLAVVALAGPAWERQQSTGFRVPDAWVLVLDLSPSMAATDVTPDRATRARYAIADLLSAARDARVGLVVYAGEPHTVAPLTTDVVTVRELLQPLAPSLMPESGDQLGPALDEAERLLSAGGGARGKVVVLSDGCADPAQALLAAQRLRQRGTAVDVVGVGTPAGAPEPDGSGRFVRDAQGHTRLTRLQTDQLQRIAAAGGGRFVPLSELKDLIPALQAGGPREFDSDAAAPSTQVASWRNEGVWLLPPLLLLAALLARRGWI